MGRKKVVGALATIMLQRLPLLGKGSYRDVHEGRCPLAER